MGDDWVCDECGFTGGLIAMGTHVSDTGHRDWAKSDWAKSVSGNEQAPTPKPAPEPPPKPMVTREQYQQARAVLDSLPSGFYVKCDKCKGWFTNSGPEKLFVNNGGVITCKDGCTP